MVGGRKSETPVVEAEDNHEGLAKDELSRLSRQLRLMENDKRAYLYESNGALNYQKNVLKSLGWENKKIESDLEILKMKSNEDRDRDKDRIVFESVEICKKLGDECRVEGVVKGKFLVKVKDASERVEDLKLFVGRKEKQEASINQLQQKIFVTKRKLETVTGKFDAVVAENAQSRKFIDEALQENVAIMLKYGEVSEEIEKLKTSIDDLVDQATVAYDHREEAVTKVTAMLERSVKEKKHNTLEISELSRIIRHEKKLLDFMNTKNKDRLFLETCEERISRLELAKEKVTDVAIESYRKNFDKLLTKTSPTILAIANEYQDLYHSNIRMFAYINELNTNIEILQLDVVRFRSQIRACLIETVEQNQSKNKVILSCQTTLEELSTNFEEIKRKVETLETSMADIVISMTNLFKMIEYNGTVPVLELLGTNRAISSQNVILYMNILEERISEIFSRLRKEKIFSDSDVGTISITKSLRPSSKSGSTFSVSVRPQLDNTSPRQGSDEHFFYNLVDTVQDPLAYKTMREKVIDASAASRSTSSVSGENSISSSILPN